jgi:hypothetical protein
LFCFLFLSLFVFGFNFISLFISYSFTAPFPLDCVHLVTEYRLNCEKSYRFTIDCRETMSSPSFIGVVRDDRSHRGKYASSTHSDLVTKRDSLDVSLRTREAAMDVALFDLVRDDVSPRLHHSPSTSSPSAKKNKNSPLATKPIDEDLLFSCFCYTNGMAQICQKCLAKRTVPNTLFTDVRVAARFPGLKGFTLPEGTTKNDSLQSPGKSVSPTASMRSSLSPPHSHSKKSPTSPTEYRPEQVSPLKKLRSMSVTVSRDFGSPGSSSKKTAKPWRPGGGSETEQALLRTKLSLHEGDPYNGKPLPARWSGSPSSPIAEKPFVANRQCTKAGSAIVNNRYMHYSAYLQSTSPVATSQSP